MGFKNTFGACVCYFWCIIWLNYILMVLIPVHLYLEFRVMTFVKKYSKHINSSFHFNSFVF